jgi:hypothetical protein
MNRQLKKASRFRWFMAFVVLAFHFQAAIILWYFYIPRTETDCDILQIAMLNLIEIDRSNFVFTNVHLIARRGRRTT